MKKGYLNFILNAHLPYLFHPDDPFHFEQRWLYESICESYIPLIETLRRVVDRGNNAMLTLSLSPPLCAMLADRELMRGFEDYMSKQIDLARHEVRKNRKTPRLSELSRMYLERYLHVLKYFTRDCRKDIIKAFRELSRDGVLTLITSSATHAYLPLLIDYPGAVKAQVKGGMEIFRRTTGLTSSGFWLPECGFFPGLENTLLQAGVKYSILDAHGLVFAKPCPSTSVYRPVRDHAGLVWYGRDSAASELIWSAESGYPADGEYRDFYDDLVYSLDEEEVKEFIHPGSFRFPSGIKYRSVSAPGEKSFYDSVAASKKVTLHARHFMSEISALTQRIIGLNIKNPIITVAFDAELFGHWWHEGCLWLDELFSLVAGQHKVVLTSGEGIIIKKEFLETVMPAESSWGEGGYNTTWLNERNDWLLMNVLDATEEVTTLVRDHGIRAQTDPLVERALNGAVREMLMIQASDWSFLLDKGVSEPYVRKRIENHASRISFISEHIGAGRLSERSLKSILREDGRFEPVDFRWMLD